MKQGDIRNLFKNVTLRMDTNIKLVIPSDNYDRYSIFEIYYPGIQAGVNINEIGFYTYNNLTYFNKDVSFYIARKNMSGILLRTGNRVRISIILDIYFFNSVDTYN